MSDQLLSGLSLGINWNNGTGFDNIKRIKFSRKFKNITVDEKIFSKEQDSSTGYFDNNRNGLSVGFNIARDISNIGIHSIYVYYSFNTQGNLWISIIDSAITQNITLEHIQQNFDEILGGAVSFAPTFEDNSTFTSAISGERYRYKLKNETGDMLFDDSEIEIISYGTDGGFAIRNTSGNYLSVGVTGEISWVSDFDNSTKLYRVSMKLDDDTEVKFIMTGSSFDEFILYKPSGLEPETFVTFQNMTETKNANIIIRDMSTGRYEILKDYKEIEYDTQNYRGYKHDTACYIQHSGDCLNDPTCKGLAIVPEITEARYSCEGAWYDRRRIICATRDVTIRSSGCATFHGDGNNKYSVQPKEFVYTEY